MTARNYSFWIVKEEVAFTISDADMSTREIAYVAHLKQTETT